MKFNYGRRRFLSFCFYGAISLTCSDLTFASYLPSCESGEITRNGWRANWNGYRVEINDNKKSTFERHGSDIKLYPDLTPSDFEIEKDPNNFLEVTFKYEASKTPWIVIDVPQSFETKDARYKFLNHMKAIYDGSGFAHDVHITLKRGGTKRLKTKINPYLSWQKISLNDERLTRFFGEEDNPLVIEYSADGRILFSRKYDVNGILRAYLEAKPKYLQEESKVRNNICEVNIGVFS